MIETEIEVEVHVTRINGANIYGHERSHCDESGCAGDEMFLGAVDDGVWGAMDGVVEEGHTYEMRLGGGQCRVIAESRSRARTTLTRK